LTDPDARSMNSAGKGTGTVGYNAIAARFGQLADCPASAFLCQDMDPFIGDKWLDSVHGETFKPYIAARRTSRRPSRDAGNVDPSG